MLQTLPAPEVVRCYFDDVFEPPLPAMCLRWPAETQDDYRTWHLPDDVNITGPVPRRFGLTVQRHGTDSYTVRLLWDRTVLAWQALTRAHLAGSDLVSMLEALGSDIWYLLDQPIQDTIRHPDRAA